MDVMNKLFDRPLTTAFIKSGDPDSMVFRKDFRIIILVHVPFKGWLCGVILEVSIDKKTDMIQLA